VLLGPMQRERHLLPLRRCRGGRSVFERFGLLPRLLLAEPLPVTRSYSVKAIRFRIFHIAALY
jgi:hypothetical protein